jgi:hypothetical protein
LRQNCDPFGGEAANKLGRKDIDLVYVESVQVGSTPLECEPFVDGSIRGSKGQIRLTNGEGFIICELNAGSYANPRTAYTTPLSILLYYGYRNTAEKKLLIKNERTDRSSAGAGGGYSSNLPDWGPEGP